MNPSIDKVNIYLKCNHINVRESIEHHLLPV